MRFSLPPTPAFRAYTLVELLIALTLSLILLLGTVELFSRVGGAMHAARTTLNLTENLDAVERLLRADLGKIPSTLTTKPGIIVGGGTSPDDSDGYLEITEGPDHIDDDIDAHPYVNEAGEIDPTVGDVDDIIGFTITSRQVPFRGWIDKQLAERNSAEVVWFVRGNTLYRRVILLEDDQVDDLADRQNRFGHDGRTNPSFPYPLYPAGSPWWDLRMPTIEEFYHTNFHDKKNGNSWFEDSNSNLTLTTVVRTDNPDLWNQPYFYPSLQDRKSGSLIMFVDEQQRSPHAGEDVVLTNVLSFDIKVWDEAAKDFVDLGSSTIWGQSQQPGLGNVWDSWTQEYKPEPPPYATPLTAIQITVRCFDPATKAIKQITVVHGF